MLYVLNYCTRVNISFNVQLSLDGYSDKAGEPYCKSCYGKLFGPKGFIGGTTSFNNFDVDAGADTRIINNRHEKVTDHHTLPSTDVADIKGARESSTTHAKHCAKCSKSVSLPEERLACTRVWHTDCFTCGGLQADGCNKKLSLAEYTAHGNDPYCKSCYTK